MKQINKMRLFDAFREDHAVLGRGLHALRERLATRDATGARTQAQRIDREAGAHIAFEEEDFYPALASFLGEREVDGMYRAHAEGLALVRDVMSARDADLVAGDEIRDFLRRVDAMSDHVAACGELFGAMGGLADDDIDRLLQRLAHWRDLAPRWSERGSKRDQSTGSG